MSTFQGRQEWATKISWFFELWDLVKRGFRSVISYCFFLRGLLCNLEQEYRVGSFHLLSLGQDGRYLRFFFPHLLFFVFAIVASRFDASQKNQFLCITLLHKIRGFFSHQPYHFTHKSISNYCLFKKNLVTAASLLFCFCHSRSLGDRELRDVNKTGIHRIYLLPPPLPFLPHKRSIQIFCCEAWREKAFPDTLLGFGNLECCKNTCVGKKTKEIVQNDAQKKWERNNIF